MRMKKKTMRPRRRKEEPLVRKKSRYLENVIDVPTGDYELLRKFVTEHGKIMASRITGATAMQQRQIKKAVRRARVMGLLP